jgi:3-hydroxyisobutyrate dehydrogenase
MNSLKQNSTTLGFIGLGGMGSRIALRLVAAGYHVSVFNRNPSKTDALKQKGAMPANSIGELAKSVDVVLSCLTDDQAVRQVYYGPAGVLANAKQGLLIFEMSTVLPVTSRELALEASKSGVQVMDVAISGSTPAAELGTLTLLVGGAPDVFQAALPVFQSIASKHFHLGPSGAGTTMKMVVNAILGVVMQAVAEAVVLGERAGLSRDVLLQVLSQTAVIPPALTGKLPKAARQDYSAQFPLPLMNKDFGLILNLARDVHALMPATSAAFQMSSEALSLHGGQDFSAIMKFMEEVSTGNTTSHSDAK